MQKSAKIIIIASFLLLLAAFAPWAMWAGGSLFAYIMAAVYALLFCVVILVSADNFVTELAFDPLPGPDAELGPRQSRFSRRHPWVSIALTVLITRIALYVIAYFISYIADGYQGGLFDTLYRLWARTDSPSYLGIAQNWYVTEGDPRFHIVFLPFYPIVTGTVNFLVRNVFASALIVSNLCACASACFAYELFALDLKRADALRATRYLFLLPAAFFLQAPMTESLFLLICLACIFLARKRLFLPACALAALAGFTRSAGVLLGLPIAIEMLFDLTERARDGERIEKPLVTDVFYLLIVPLGTLAYLAVNYTVTGDPLKFLEYQRDHWSQGLGWFFNTAAYQTDYAISAARAGDMRMLLGLYLPGILSCLAALGLMVGAGRKLRSSYVAYFLVYFAFSIGATWLLSAPRYLTVCFPLALALGALTERKWVDITVSAVMAAIMIAYMGLYVTGAPVY